VAAGVRLVLAAVGTPEVPGTAADPGAGPRPGAAAGARAVPRVRPVDVPDVTATTVAARGSAPVGGTPPRAAVAPVPGTAVTAAVGIRVGPRLAPTAGAAGTAADLRPVVGRRVAVTRVVLVVGGRRAAATKVVRPVVGRRVAVIRVVLVVVGRRVAVIRVVLVVGGRRVAVIRVVLVVGGRRVAVIRVGPVAVGPRAAATRGAVRAAAVIRIVPPAVTRAAPVTTGPGRDPHARIAPTVAGRGMSDAPATTGHRVARIAAVVRRAPRDGAEHPRPGPDPTRPVGPTGARRHLASSTTGRTRRDRRPLPVPASDVPGGTPTTGRAAPGPAVVLVVGTATSVRLPGRVVPVAVPTPAHGAVRAPRTAADPTPATEVVRPRALVTVRPARRGAPGRRRRATVPSRASRSCGRGPVSPIPSSPRA
jgi:hypothetical protein